MPTTSPRIPSTSCCWGGTRSPASAWRRNRRCRDSRTASARAPCTGWHGSWPRASSSGTGDAGRGGARRITIDLDPTDDPTHGAQQLTFFNGFYDTWCYLPLLAFVTFGREAEQYLCAAVLRPGNAVASEGAVALLSRLLPLLRRAFPRARFLVRLDAGFATPEVFDFLDTCPRLDYVVSMPKNAVLVRHAEPAMTRARARSARSGRTEHVYGETHYAAGSWKRQRRVVIKAEVVRLAGREPRDNPRFVVTNLGRPPRSVYEKVYCARGTSRTGSRSCSTGCRSTARQVAAGSLRTSFGSC